MIHIIMDRFVNIAFLNSITVRSIISLFVSFLLCMLLIPTVMRKVNKRKLGQQVRECGPEAHLEKQGVATMGGIAIVISVLLVTVFFVKLNPIVLISLFVMLAMSFAGLIDDLLKIYRQSSDGMSGKMKILFQIGVSFLALLFIHLFIPDFEYLTIPVVGYRVTSDILYYLVFILTVTASSNAVNLTDGLDGLAGGILLVVCIVYAAITYISGNIIYSQHLSVPYIEGCGEMTVLISSLAGALIGFLWYNSYPAQIFMGDVGSLSLGALVGMMAIFTKTELLLIVIGGIFVVEALSVIIQVLSFRIRKKRVFRMAPIHHHFELSGLHETKVVIRLWITSLFLAMCGLLLFVIRVLFR